MGITRFTVRRSIHELSGGLSASFPPAACSAFELSLKYEYNLLSVFLKTL